MGDFPRIGQRKPHYPHTGPTSTPLKLHSRPRELRLPPKDDYLSSNHSFCPEWTSYSQHLISRYPNYDPSILSSSDYRNHPFFHPQHSFHDYPSILKHPHHRSLPIPCPAQEWNFWKRYHNTSSQPSLKAWYPECQSAGMNSDFMCDIQLNHINLQKADRDVHWQSVQTIRDRGSLRERWQSSIRSQHKDTNHSKGRWLDHHHQLSVFEKRDVIRRQPVNTINTVLKKKRSGRRTPSGVTHITETLNLFIEKLKKFPTKENTIQTIENCVTASHLPIKTSYIIDQILLETNDLQEISGALYINDVFIACSSCTGKKMLKHKVYDAALQILKTKSAEDLITQHGLRQRLGLLPSGMSSVIEERGTQKDDLKGKLLKLQEYFKKFKYPQNVSIISFDKAFLESQCKLKHRYHVEAIRTELGTHVYTRTRIFIEGKTIAYALARSKKESKARACQKVVNLFTTTDVDTIIHDHFEVEQTEDELPEDIQQLLKKHRFKPSVLQSHSAVTKYEQEQCLDRLIQDLKLPTKDGVSTVMTIDKNCVQMKMKLLAVYKTVRSPGEPTFITCDLYILDHLISQGRGTTRKMAQTDAYSKGGEVLQKSKGTDVLTDFPKFSEEELSKSDVLDIVYKGYAKVYESNHCRLNRLKQLPEGKRNISELVIIEHQDWVEDRKKHSHCILNQSATQCGCLLEWTTEPENGCFRCTMKLQGEEICSVLAKQRKTAVGIASSVALFNLYETQPVVQGFHLDYPKVWISREELLKRSESYLQEDCQNVSDVETHDNQEVDKKISRAIQEMLDQFFSQSTLKDFVGGPDWKPEEKKLLRNLALAQGLRVVTDVYCEERLPVINRKYDLSEMVNILEKQPNRTQGRYRLLPDEEKPSYNDIVGEVAVNESIVKRYQTMTGVDTQFLSLVESDDDADEEADRDKYLDDEDDSKDSDAFITADSSFFDVASIDDRIKENTTPKKMISEISLPRRTSTPVKVKTDKTTYNNDKAGILTTAASTLGNLSQSGQVKCMSPASVEYYSEECSRTNLTSFVSTASATVATDKDCTPSSTWQKQKIKRYLETSSVQHCPHPLTDIQRINSPKDDLHQKGAQIRLSQPQSKPHWKKFNRSIDLEAGVNGIDDMHKNQRRLQQGQYWSHRQHMEQHQWMEQEHQES